MDKILIEGLKVFAYHGVNPEEKITGQNFVLDVALYTDLKVSGMSDEINDTVSYAKAAKLIVKVMQKESYDLLEKAATEVCKEILKTFETIQKVKVRLKKPEAPVKLDFDFMAVEITRDRSDFVL